MTPSGINAACGTSKAGHTDITGGTGAAGDKDTAGGPDTAAPRPPPGARRCMRRARPL